MVKRVFIVHGWGGNPDEPFHKWLKKELEEREFDVTVPAMPNTDKPEISAWVSYLSKIVGDVDKDTYFIGHSMGCQTIMRFLEKQKTKIGGAIFVAGWFNLANLENKEEERIAEPWIKSPINFDNVKKVADKIIVFLSSNEPYGYVKENKDTFTEKLNAKVIIKKNMGHFSPDDGVYNLPEALDKLLAISK